jgi:hypothetical protein
VKIEAQNINKEETLQNQFVEDPLFQQFPTFFNSKNFPLMQLQLVRAFQKHSLHKLLVNFSH